MDDIFILSDNGKELLGFKYISSPFIKLPDGITRIGNEAFKGCKFLQSIVIPNSVNSIGHLAFEDCTSLKDIDIPDSVTCIGYWAFKGTRWLDNHPTGIIYINDVLYELKGDRLQINTLTIRQGTISISDYAFLNCTSLQHVDIPDSMKKKCFGAFKGCSSLRDINIPDSVNCIEGLTFKECSGYLYLKGYEQP